MTSWEDIWNKKGLEKTDSLNRMAGFDLHYKDSDLMDVKQTDMIIDACNIDKNDKILDIGCGPGRLGRVFVSKGYNYYGLDKSETLVSKFNTVCGKVVSSKMQHNKVEFDDKTFDVTFFYSVAQYLNDDDDFKNFINEVKRVTKRVIFMGDLETVDGTDKVTSKYEYTPEKKIEHYCVNKEWFDSYSDKVTFDTNYCSKPTRYNATIQLET